MNVYLKARLIAMLVVAGLSLRVLAAEDSSDVPLRMANGTIMEGTVQKATPEGLVIQGEKGQYTASWKYLSAGTRYRYELPMLVEQEVARSNALKKAAADAVAASKAAADKAAAAEKAAADAKAAATNATVTNAVGSVSNMPPARAKK